MNPFNERLNEIIFEKRNKTYGAYVLRKEYPDSLRIALILAAAFIGVITVSGILLKKDQLKLPDISVVPELPGIPVVIEPQKPELPEDAKQQKKATVPVVPPAPAPPVASDQKETKDPEPPAEPAESGPIAPGEATQRSGVSSGPGGELPPSEPPVEPPPLVFASEMPTIEGGILPYVASHLNYPEEAKENRTGGTVRISFVVEKDGSISNINILNDPKIGDGCEEEAIRVIKSAKWNPGKNNGQPVRVQLSMPVRYKIQ